MSGTRNRARQVAYLDHGVLVEQGTPEQIFSHPQHESTRTFLERVR
jgi:ABC-type methionine transport system ATPase subunit